MNNLPTPHLCVLRCLAAFTEIMVLIKYLQPSLLSAKGEYSESNYTAIILYNCSTSQSAERQRCPRRCSNTQDRHELMKLCFILELKHIEEGGGVQTLAW